MCRRALFGSLILASSEAGSGPGCGTLVKGFLAAMSSSSSDNVTQYVRACIRAFVRPGPFFGVFVYQLR